MKNRRYRPGDRVVYRMSKRSTCPGKRAEQVSPSRYGESYTYCVDKFWVVVDQDGDQVVVQTRRGKQHVLEADNRNLKRAGIWDLLVNRHRFPSLDSARVPNSA